MKKFVSGKCPNCGANLELDNEQTTAFCAYCGSKISVEEAAEKLKIELSGKIEIDGINSVRKLYENAESYIKLKDYDNAFNTYRTIINNNPEEIPAYKGALIAASYDMTREVSIYNGYPSDFSELFNTYLDYIKKLDTKSQYTDFVNAFSAYFNKQTNAEKNLKTCDDINYRISNLPAIDATNYRSFNKEYTYIMNMYNELDDEYKTKVSKNIEELKSTFENAPKLTFFSHGIGKAIKWYLIISLGIPFIIAILVAIFG